MEKIGDKCIVLARVSTEGQDYTEQVKWLREAALADGFAAENIITINNKESAIKLSEEKRLGLSEMKEAIENDPAITTVYVREVSRIGRRYDVLCNTKAYFVTKKIQLIVCGNSRSELLDAEGNVTLAGNLMFEIACQCAIQEMADKKIRFAQGVKRAQAAGRIGCGKPCYGYAIMDGRLAVNEEEAQVVRWVFDTYVNTEASTNTIYKKLRDRGTWKPYSQRNVGCNRVSKMLRNLSYSGRHAKLQYPPIVSEELQDEAIAKAMRQIANPKTEHKHVYYASGLVRCECGHRMSAELSYTAYCCSCCRKKISLNQLDFVAWHETQVLKTLQMQQDKVKVKAEAEKQIKENDEKIIEVEKRMSELEKKEESVADVALLTISDSDRRREYIASKMEKVRAEQKQLRNTIAKLRYDNQRLESVLNDDNRLLEAMYLAGIDDDKERKQIINETIERINVERIDANRVKFVIVPKVTVWGWNVDYVTYYVYDRIKRTYPNLYRVTGEHSEDMRCQVVKRFGKHLH